MSNEIGKENNHALCLECGDRIAYGRADKKFCSDTCKNKFHNRVASCSRRYRQKVHSALERNYFILDSLRKTSMKRMRLEDMRTMGFRQEFFTSYSRSATRDVFMCYDIKYCVKDGMITSIVKLSNAAMETSE